MKLYSIIVFGMNYQWCFESELTDEQVKAMRDDGIDVSEIICQIPVPESLVDEYRKKGE
jgi:hypothetical protein